MKKSITMKFFSALIVALLAVGLNAQINNDYVEATGAEANDTVTVNKTTRLYVYPDPVFSPSYDRSDNSGRGATQRWEWMNGAIKAASVDNWVDSSYSSTGNVTVQVSESSTTGSCNGDTNSITVVVIPESSVTFTADDDPGGIFGPTAAGTYCEGDARLSDVVQATFTNAILAARSPSFQIQYSITVDTVHESGNPWVNIAAADSTFDGATGTQEAVTGTTHNLVHGLGHVCINDGVDYPTRYTYTINGVTDRISRKSDYIANSAAAADSWNWHDTGAETLIIIVNPAPVTGPIYHISNMWAN